MQSGLRLYKSGYDIKGKPEKWPEYIEEQLEWAIRMRRLIDELELWWVMVGRMIEVRVLA